MAYTYFIRVKNDRVIYTDEKDAFHILENPNIREKKYIGRIETKELEKKISSINSESKRLTEDLIVDRINGTISEFEFDVKKGRINEDCSKKVNELIEIIISEIPINGDNQRPRNFSGDLSSIPPHLRDKVRLN